MTRVDRWLENLGGLFLPPRCLLCGAQGTAGRDLCTGCAADLIRNGPCCPRCALPLAAPAPLCGECLDRGPAFAVACVPFVYAAPLDVLVTRCKFQRDLAAARVLAGLFRAQAARSVELPQALVPVPLHPQRLRERGYNQALEIARPLARRLGIPLCPDLLHRVRATEAQTHLDAPARRRNLRDAFAAGPAPLPGHIALFDDVMTTGATLAECARVLRAAGVARVDVWAVARVARGGAGP